MGLDKDFDIRTALTSSCDNLKRLHDSQVSIVNSVIDNVFYTSCSLFHVVYCYLIVDKTDKRKHTAVQQRNNSPHRTILTT